MLTDRSAVHQRTAGLAGYGKSIEIVEGTGIEKKDPTEGERN